MAITIQQFDFIASIQGIDAALTTAEQAGGITGTRDSGPTMVTTNESGGRSLTAGGPVPGVMGGPDASALAAAKLPDVDWYGDSGGGGTGKGKPDPKKPDEGKIIAAWINDLINGRTGLGNNQSAVKPVTTESLMASLAARLGRTLTAKEFTEIVLPSIPQAWRPTWNLSEAGSGNKAKITTPDPNVVVGGGKPGGYVNILGDDLTTPSATGPSMSNRLAYQQQDPNTAFTRFLAQREGTAPVGTGGREAQERRGDYLAPLATAFGYGLTSAVGGQGQDYAGFYSKYGDEDPSYADIQGRARAIQGHLAGTSKADLAAYLKLIGAGGLSSEQTGAPFSTVMAGQYEPQGKQFELTRAGLSSQINPYLQAGLNRALQARFEQQQAVDPSTRWLDYAIAQGLI